MIKDIIIENYKCFKIHSVPLRKVTIVVGKNNAGKSTIVEVLRLVSIVTEKYRNIPFYSVPHWITVPCGNKGVSPSLKDSTIDFEKIFYRYNDPPAIITTNFESGATIKIYLGENKNIFATIRGANGKFIINKQEAQKCNLHQIKILPQIGPLSQSEVVLEKDYIRNTKSSYLSTLHFRNELKVFSEFYDDFKESAEATWTGLEIQNLEGTLHKEPLQLMVRDGDFVAEVGAMGHGLQMWLQVIWFLSNIGKNPNMTVILDEPDVYMHADLQRKLIRFIRGKYNQTIITTHSTEIISEEDHENILIIDKANEKSLFAQDLPAVQELLERNIGSIYNIHLARLWNSKCFLLVEGEDIEILKHFHRSLFPESNISFSALPHLEIGGWGGWKTAAASPLIIKNAIGEYIKIYCILDRDYQQDKTIEDRYKESRSSKIHLHIWNMKEIENYAIVPSAICRLINEKSNINAKEKDICAKINNIVKKNKKDVIIKYANSIQEMSKGSSQKAINTCMKEATEIIDSKWKKSDLRWSLVSGKQIIGELSEWSKKEYGVSIAASRIARIMNVTEIPKEMKDVITAIEKNNGFKHHSSNKD